MEALEFRNVGPRLRAARKTKRLRLKDVASEVGCSESLLSKIECDKATPSLRVLHRIATVLDTSIGHLFTDTAGGEVVIYRAGERPTVTLENDAHKPQIRLERLARFSDDQILDGNIHVIEPRATNGGEIKHLGQEIGYVLEGEFELTVGGRIHQLQAGDSFFFPSDLPHSYRNVGSTLAKVIWINSPPTF